MLTARTVEVSNLVPLEVKVHRYWRYLDDRVIAFVVGSTVAHDVHPVPGEADGPERTWITRVVPVGTATSRVRVSHPTVAPASTTAEV
jgi:hypothetical protein